MNFYTNFIGLFLLMVAGLIALHVLLTAPRARWPRGVMATMADCLRHFVFKFRAALLLFAFFILQFAFSLSAQAQAGFPNGAVANQIAFIALDDPMTNATPNVPGATNASGAIPSTNVVTAAAFSNCISRQPFLIRPGYGVALRCVLTNGSAATSSSNFSLYFRLNLDSSTNFNIGGAGVGATNATFTWNMFNGGQQNIGWTTNLGASLCEGYYSIELMGATNADTHSVTIQELEVSRPIPWANGAQNK